MFEPVTFVLYVAGVSTLGALWGYKRALLRRFLRALDEHPRVEVRDGARGRLMFSALVECPPRGTVSVVLDRTTGALEWTFEAHLVRAAEDVEIPLGPGRAPGAPFEGLSASRALARAQGALLADTWEVQRLALVDRRLLLEAREQVRLDELDVDAVVRRAEALAALAEALGEAFGEALREVSLCPLCRSVPLAEGVGVLGEARCPSCGGRFFSTEAARRLLEGELGADLFALKAASSERAGGLSCAACHSRMRPVVVQEQIVNLCAGCGGVWLDEEELELLSEGRYREIGA